MQWFTGKGYGVSDITDVTGRPLLTYQGPDDKKPFLIADRVAQTFDFTIPQQLPAGAMRNDRLDSATASAAKKILGGGTDDELDHKISLELGGANTPANLWIQHGITAGPSASSDTLENNLALDVVAGKISLLQAWRTLEDQKGFLLPEDMTTSKKIAVIPLILQLAGNLKDYITGAKKATIGAGQPELKQKIDQLTAALAKDPLNQALQESVIATQVQLNAQILNVSTTEAAQATKTALAAYAESKGVDPREIIGATNANIQTIIANSKATPNIFGLSTITLAAILTGLAGTLASVGIVAFVVGIIGVIMVGPEAIAGALTGGLFESIGGLIGVSPLAAAGFGTLAVSEAVAAMLFLIGQGIKTIYDQGYLLPTQNITAMKDALAIQKGLAGFLPSTQQPGMKTAAPSGGASGAGAPSAPATLFLGHINQGNLQEVKPFTASEAAAIESPDDLANAAQNNIAAFLSSIPAAIDYQISLKTSVVNDDGSVAVGAIIRYQKGTTKKGAPTYGKIQDKFAVATVFLKTPARGRIKVEEIILGPVDETKYKPTAAELADLVNQLAHKLITTNLSTASSITLAPPVSAPQQALNTAKSAVAAAEANPTPENVQAATAAVSAAAAAIPTPAATPAPVQSTPAPVAEPVSPTILVQHTFLYWPAAGSYYIDGSIRGSAPSRAIALQNAQAQYPNIIDLGDTAAPAGAAGRPQADKDAQMAPTATTPQPEVPANSFQKTITVNVPVLNVRAAPNSTAPLAGSQKLVQGNQFIATGWIRGENVSGEDRWWISSRGNYVWAGGTAEKPY